MSYVRNSAIDANNLLSAPGFNTLRFNQFGATLGGPFRKDKSFYFARLRRPAPGESPIYSHFILKCIDTEGCLGPALQASIGQDQAWACRLKTWGRFCRSAITTRPSAS